MKPRFPRPLSECLEAAAKPALAKYGLLEARLVRDWETIVGPELAAICLPHGLSFPQQRREGGTLTLLTTGAHALEVQHMQPLILEKLGAYFGYRAVNSLRLRQGTLPRKSTPKTLPKRATAATAPLPVPIEDPDLRAALEGLARALHSSTAGATIKP